MGACFIKTMRLIYANTKKNQAEFHFLLCFFLYILFHQAQSKEKAILIFFILLEKSVLPVFLMKYGLISV